MLLRGRPQQRAQDLVCRPCQYRGFAFRDPVPLVAKSQATLTRMGSSLAERKRCGVRLRTACAVSGSWGQGGEGVPIPPPGCSSRRNHPQGMCGCWPLHQGSSYQEMFLELGWPSGWKYDVCSSNLLHPGNIPGQCQARGGEPCAQPVGTPRAGV